MRDERWSIVEYRGPTALRRLEGDWRRLYSSMPLRNSAHLYEAHLAYLEHLMASPDRFRCLALHDGRAVRAICPLEARADTSLGVPIPAWAIPRHLLTPVGDAVCADDEAGRALAPMVAGFLRHHPEGRQLLVLGPVPADSLLWGSVKALDPVRCCTQVTHRIDVFDCGRPFDDLMARLKKHFRRNLRSHRNKLNKLNDVRFVTAADDSTLSEAFETFLDIEASGWKGEQGTRTAIRCKPNQPAFFRALARSFGEDDRCEINALHVDGRCIASEFCVRTGAEYARVKIGYDEEYARLGPGQLILETTLERLCGDPEVTWFNMMSGAGWLDDWHPDKLVLQQAHVALGRWSGPPLTALLRFRFGPGRKLARSARARYEEWRKSRTDGAGEAPRARRGERTSAAERQRP